MKAIVLLSGGLDSAVALTITARTHDVVEALTIDYGQRHAREINAAADIADWYDVPHTIISLDQAIFGASSALTSGTRTDVPDGAATEPDATYVPARNTVLLAIATARAEALGAGMVVIGANADDAAAYPDCRPGYLEAFRDAVGIGTVGHIWISAPLLHRTKTDVVTIAMTHGVPGDLTYSCYRGGPDPCRTCGACITRAAAEQAALEAARR